MEAVDQLQQIFIRLREDANSFLSRYEPIALVSAPLIVLIFAHAVESFVGAVQEKGLVRAVLAFAMAFVRLIPGVDAIIDREKKKVDIFREIEL